MSKEGLEDSYFHKAEEMGRKNKSLIQSVGGWCRHIEVRGRRASMLGEMLDIPMSTTISCPHAGSGGYEGANLEWNARDFIIENCINCDKHNAVTSDNYGIKVTSEYYENKKKKEQEEKAKIERMDSLREEAELLIKKEKTRAEVKKLSIIRLIEKLDSPDEGKDIAEKLLQSARLSPEFFSEAAVNYVSLFLERDDIGTILTETIDELQGAGHRLSTFARENVLGAVRHGKSFDLAVSIWGNSLDDGELVSYTDVFNTIVGNCRYNDFYHFGQNKAKSYPKSVGLLGRLYKINSASFREIFHKLLTDEDTYTRVNINGLLRGLNEAGIGDIIDFLPLLVRSFDFIDNERSGESGDYQTMKTILKLYTSAPKKVIDVCLFEGNKLSEWGKAELVEVYERIILEDHLYGIDSEVAKELVVRLNGFLLGDSNKAKLVESSLDAIRQIASRRADVLSPYFDLYIGFLIKCNQERQKFEWYRQDAADLSKPATTFNPLVGKHFLELDKVSMDMDKLFRGAGDVITNLVKEDSEEYLPGLLEVADKIDSKTDGEFKAKLIGLVQKSAKDILSMADILPKIYGYLHDTESEEVRIAGMKFVVYLIEKYPQLVTETLIELVKVFFGDKVVGVCGLAVDAYGQLINQFPEQMDKQCFDRIYQLISDRYVFVHKAALSFSYSAYPFLSENERALWTVELYRYADGYCKKGDFSYAFKVTKMALYCAAGNTLVHRNIIESLITRLCNCKDYYLEKDALHYLTYLTKTNKDYVAIWMTQTIGFLGRTLPKGRYQPNDDRKELMQFFFELDEADIIKHTVTMINHVKSSIDSVKLPVIPDVIHFHAVFARFNLWDAIKELSEYFAAKVPVLPKYDSIHYFNQRSLRIAETEIKVGSGTISLRYIQDSINARP